jgi:fatty acid desaturase
MHGLLIGFHEASHGLLRKTRRLNEIDGVIIGIFSLMSFSLYRAAHQLHHAYLATERDVELWPFVITKMPRWFRVLARFSNSASGFSSRHSSSYELFFVPILRFGTKTARQSGPIRTDGGVWFCYWRRWPGGCVEILSACTWLPPI